MSVGLQLSFIEWLRVLLVGIQSQYQGGTFLNDANTRMAPSVDPSFMRLRLTKPAFQVQVVSR
jgi:hypothetical protein